MAKRAQGRRPAVIKGKRDLTARQEGFAKAVATGKTKADAYRQNYTCDGWPVKKIADCGDQLARSPTVAKRLAELTKAKERVAAKEFDVTVTKLLQTYVEIAFTDPNEITSMVRGACRWCHGTDGEYQWQEWEFVEALEGWRRAHAEWEKAPAHKRGEEPACPHAPGGFGYRFKRTPSPACERCEGDGEIRMRIMDTTTLSAGAKHLYRGVQQTKDGVKILFGDKDKALDSIGRMLGAFDDRLRVDLKANVAALALTTTDPEEAAKAYQQMLTASSS